MRRFAGVLLLAMLAAGVVNAQSEDQDNPTPLTSNVITGEGDGKATTYYYSFTAGPGDVKVTVDGKTDNYSSPLRVKLMDENGKDLLDVYVVANNPSKREVGQRRFVRQQKVIMSVSMNDDAQVKLMSFKIKLDDAVAFEGGPEASGTSTPDAPGGSTPTPTPTPQPTPEPTEQARVTTGVNHEDSNRNGSCSFFVCAELLRTLTRR